MGNVLALAGHEEEVSSTFVNDADPERAARAASRCREALTRFLWLEPGDRAGLARWLRREYAPQTVAAVERDVELPDEDERASWPLERIVADAQRSLVRLFVDPSLVAELVVTAVLRARVRHVAGAWRPVDRERQKLADRVATLVAAMDLNNAPEPPTASERRELPVFISGPVEKNEE